LSCQMDEQEVKIGGALKQEERGAFRREAIVH
jgi:hypothetical protein